MAKEVPKIGKYCFTAGYIAGTVAEKLDLENLVAEIKEKCVSGRDPDACEKAKDKLIRAAPYIKDLAVMLAPCAPQIRVNRYVSKVGSSELDDAVSKITAYCHPGMTEEEYRQCIIGINKLSSLLETLDLTELEKLAEIAGKRIRISVRAPRPKRPRLTEEEKKIEEQIKEWLREEYEKVFKKKKK